MADSWELICDQTYSGTPGVVYDASPDHQSHGTTVDLAGGNFVADGATAGSGAIRFDSPGALIRVLANKSWQPLEAIRAEVTLWIEPAPPGGVLGVSRLIDAGSVQFDLRSGGLRAWFVGSPLSYSEVSTHLHGLKPNFKIPTGRWITVGVHHDGMTVQELSVDGDVVARLDGLFWPVAAAGDVTIGNAPGGGSPIRGLLDGVKVWRRNPRRLVNEFFDRPMDPAISRCWANYFRELAQWVHTHPECAGPLSDAVNAAAHSMTRRALTSGAHTRHRIRESAKEYRRLWRAGQLDSPEMAALLADMEAWLSSAGIGPNTNPEVQALLDSDCLRQLRSTMPALDCDAQFQAMSRHPRVRD